MEEVEPDLLHMTHYQYVQWQWYGEGSYILPRFRVKWGVDALARKLEYEKHDPQQPSKRHALDDGQGPWRSLGVAVQYRLGEDGAYHKVRDN